MKQTMTSISLVVDGVLKGNLDADLEAIGKAIETRRGMIAQGLRLKLSPGTRVRFLNSVRPAYLAGVEATVVKLRRSKVQCKLDFSLGRFAKGSHLNVPPSLIEMVPEVTASEPKRRVRKLED